MSRIVALVSSPVVGGNSETIVGAILDGAMGLSTNEIAFYRLDRIHNVHGCDACNKCRGANRCIHEDDITDILEDIRRSDVVIASTPMYFSGSCSQYKTLEDRMYSFLDEDFRSRIEPGKKAIVVVTYSIDRERAEALAETMKDFYERMGFEVIGKTTFGDNGNGKAASEDKDYIEEMRALGFKLRNT